MTNKCWRSCGGTAIKAFGFLLFPLKRDVSTAEATRQCLTFKADKTFSYSSILCFAIPASKVTCHKWKVYWLTFLLPLLEFRLNSCKARQEAASFLFVIKELLRALQAGLCQIRLNINPNKLCRNTFNGVGCVEECPVHFFSRTITCLDTSAREGRVRSSILQ